MSKLQRWVDLLAALLRRNAPAPLEELVQDVPGYLRIKQKPALRRAFERDKDELRSFGIPITTEDDAGEGQGYRLRRENFYLPYLSLLQASGQRKSATTRPRDAYGYRTLSQLAFEQDELDAIVAAAQRVRSLGDPNLAELAGSALRKLAFDLPLDSGVREEPTLILRQELRELAVDILELLDQAMRDRKRVTIEYHTMSSGRDSTRTVEPWGLFFLGSQWYLAANVGGTLKNFRVSRISSAEVNDKQPGTPDFDIPAGFDLRAHARSRQAWELGDASAVEAIVDFAGSSGATVAARRLGEPVEGSQTQRRFQVRRADPFLRWLLSFAGEAQPIAPAELVEQYTELSRRTLAVYAGR